MIGEVFLYFIFNRVTPKKFWNVNDLEGVYYWALFDITDYGIHLYGWLFYSVLEKDEHLM